MTQDATVDNLKINVYWNGNLFSVQNHKHDDFIQEQDAYELLFDVYVPPFAPSGAYKLEAFVQSMGSELACLKITFTL